MFPTNLDIKTTARQTLAKAWPQAVAISFLLFGVYMFPSIILQLFDVVTGGAVYANITLVNFASTLFTAFIMFPLVFGVFRWFWGITSDVALPLSVVFSAFSSKKEYTTALKVYWAFFWRLTVANIPTALSPLIHKIDLSFLPAEFDAEIIKVSAVGFCETLTFALTVFFFISLLPLPFSVINHPCRRIRENMAESIVIAKASFTRLGSLVLSLFGWFLLCILIIPVFFVLPYFFACYAVLIRFSINYCIYSK